MQSYDSPGRIVTIVNGGEGAQDVRGDQPYRLRSYSGVTQGPAEIGEELNLCTEGVFMQMVRLADGVASARAGDLVHVSTADWSLVAGLASDGADGFEPFGQLADGITGLDLVRVKLLPAQLAGIASGGGGGGGGDASRHQTGDIETLTTRHDKAGWLPLDGRVLARAAYPALSTFFGDYVPTAVNWTTGGRAVVPNQLAGGVVYFRGLYIWGDASNAGIYTSPNGSTITRRSANRSSRALAHDGAVIMGFSAVTAAIRSADGIVWAEQALTWVGGAVSSATINGAVHAGGKWIVVGNSGQSGDFDFIGSSVDGINWTRRQCALEMQLWAVAFGNGLYVAVGDNGGIVTSPDGETWTVRNSRVSQTLRAIIHDGTRFIAAGAGGRIVTSIDGVVWNPGIIDPAMTVVSAIAHGGGVYVAIGTSLAIEGRSRIKVSSDLTTWTDRILDANPGQANYEGRTLIYAAGRFVMSHFVQAQNADLTAVSAAPEHDASVQFVLPTAVSNSPELSEWIRA